LEQKEWKETKRKAYLGKSSGRCAIFSYGGGRVGGVRIAPCAGAVLASETRRSPQWLGEETTPLKEENSLPKDAAQGRAD